MFVVNYKYEGAECEIKTFSNKKIAIGKLYRAYADHLWIVTDEPLSLVEKYEDVFVKVDMIHREYGSLTVMGQLNIDKYDEIRVSDVELISEHNQREYYRVYYMRDAKLNLVDRSGLLNMQFNTKIIDISLGGALIESTLQLPIGRELNLNVEIEENISISLKGVILRKPEMVDGKNRYGLMFTEHNQGNELVMLGLHLLKVQEENDLKNLY